MNKKIIVFGGDGFCGWPTSLKLSKEGYQVIIVDNLSRRKIDEELDCNSLTPIFSPQERINKWNQISNSKIEFIKLDISKEFKKLVDLFIKEKPSTVIHFAEQRSAPYSMKNSNNKFYTVNNNLNSTQNLLEAIVSVNQDIHLIHLGTTGYYGYSSVGLKIPEGYLPIKIDIDGEQKEMEIMYPPNPGSIYHLTKCQDALFFLYYNKNYNLRITDLHQGIVWGTQTPETSLDEKLINRFDYDGDYGTVLNRFLVQSQIGHPLTVYGSGGQTRAFINIKNTTECVLLAVQNPPKLNDKVKIFNQTTECLNVLDLAKKISKLTGTKIRYFKNPRNEDSKNDLKFVNEGLIKLGLNAVTLDNGLLKEISETAFKYKERVKIDKIISTSKWNDNLSIDFEGQEVPIED